MLTAPWLSLQAIAASVFSCIFRLFVFTSRRRTCGWWARICSAPVLWVTFLGLLSVSVLADAQTAHFDGAEAIIAAGVANNMAIGTNVLAVAVDTKGNIYFTSQNPFTQLASRGHSARYVPTALHSSSVRQLTDGRREAAAQKIDVSGCTYPGSTLYVRLASTGTVYTLNQGALSAPTGLALNSAGDLYVLDANTNSIYKFLGLNGAVQIVSTSGSGVVGSGPFLVAPIQGSGCSGGDMATDGLGNLYYTTLYGNTVEEILAVNGVIPPSPTTRSLGSSFDAPFGIAVDRSGNVYVTNVANNTVEEVLAVNGSIPASPATLTLGSGFNLPAAVTVDGHDNLYVSDLGNNALKEIFAVNGSIPSSPTIDILGSFNGTGAVTLDGSGNIFVGDSVNNGADITELTPSGANFGQVNVGVTAGAISMAFTFDAGGTLGGISVLTQGKTGLDFADAGSGTCLPNTTYSAGQSCIVNVTFTPKFAGTRAGAVVLTASNGNAVATGYVQGTGVGPQVNFLPGTQSMVPAIGLSDPAGVAVDGSGNIYIVDSNNDRVLKETPSAGGYTQSTVTSDLHNFAYGVAVDGSGAVYIADSDNNRVLKETPAASGYSESTIVSGVGGPAGIAVDSSGNVYIACNLTGQILKETLGVGGYTQSTIASGVHNPVSIAVDGSGNVYIPDGSNNRVLKETLSGGVYTQSVILVTTGLNYPSAIAVDGVGDVYIVSATDVVKETPSAGNYVTSTVVSGLSSLIGPMGAAVDSSGNLYIGDTANNRVLKEDFTDPPSLTFANTAVGTTSADSPQVVTVENNGNAALSFPIPTSGSNPNIGPDFTLTSLGQADCPVLNSESTSPATLAAGASCDIGVSFTPTVSGPLAEPMALTDNNLNAAAPTYATQSVGLMNGPATGTSFILTTSAGSLNINGGNSGTVTIAVVGQNGFAGNVSLSASGLTPGVTASFSPNPTAGTSVLTLSATDMAASVGNQPVTIIGTSGTLTASVTVYVTVISAPDFGVSISPPSLTVAPGSFGSAVIATTIDNGFNYPISLSTCNNPEAGVSVTFTPSTIPAPGNGTSTMMIAVDSNVAAGADQLCISADGVQRLYWLYIRQTPVITWPAPAAIPYGTPLSATQLDASASVPGTFTYSPNVGTVLSAGTQTLRVTFIPTDTTDYTTVTASVSLTVSKATPTISWPTPNSIMTGTALSSIQLDATASVPGTFAYSPAAGTLLPAGSQALIAVFTPTDSVDYSTATASVVLQVTPPPGFSPLSANLGVANTGTTSPVQTLTYTFGAPVTLGSSAVLTQGATGLDFADAGTGTCAANTPYAFGQSCTVNVTFTPKFAGTRNGAVELNDVNGNVIATAYLQGTGVGPQLNFAPPRQTIVAGSIGWTSGIAVDAAGDVYACATGLNHVVKETPSAAGYTQSTVTTSNLSSPYSLAVDGAGNLYIADTGNYRVLKETPAATGYSESTVASFARVPGTAPIGVAVDGSGNVYIISAAGALYKEALSGGSYIQTTIPTGLSSAASVAVDGSGNIYVTSNTTSGFILKETVSGSGYAQSNIPLPSGGVPTGLATDNFGNIFISYSGNGVNPAVGQLFEESPTASGYVQSTIPTNGMNQPWGVAVDETGNVYVADSGNYRVLKEDYWDPPSLTFASTLAGSASSDSPQTVTLENVGNADLSFPIPPSGVNPSIGTDFTLDGNAPNACPIVSSGSSGTGTLVAGTSCAFSISFAPLAAGNLNELLALTNNNLNAATPSYATQNIQLSGTGLQSTPTITWSAPAAITYGTALSGIQLDATASVPGTFSYSPAAGTVLDAGVQTLTVTFTPNDAAGYSTATASVPLTVNQATQIIAFTPPSSVAYGGSPIVLSATASSGLSVSLSISSGPATLSGNVLTVTGVGTIHLTATQSGNADYQASAPVSASIVVTKGTPSITWPAPAPIVYGTALSATQLDATSSVAGTYVYTPAGGRVLAAGTQTLSVTFTPSNTADYVKVTATVQLVVQQATTNITWSNPAAITYGKALSSTQLNAKASASGTYVYTPSSGTVLNVGTYMLSVIFTPTNTTDYTTAAASVPLAVNQATQTISFTRPASPISHTSSPITLNATTTSGLPITFTVQSGPATVSGNTLTLTGGTGTVMIVASQPGNSNYLPATPISRSITVN
jgi:sugar lactone lactonase YvrE